MSKQEITMSEMFKGYFDYTNTEYKRIWKNSLIVVDTNILLNFYRYSEDTRESFFSILDKIEDRLWIPYQVGKEFFSNKNSVMIASYNEYEDMLNSIRKIFQDAKNIIDKRKNTQLKCKSELHKVLDSNIKKIEELLSNESNEKKPSFENNEIEKHLIKIFDKSIGEEFCSEEFEKVKKEGLRRFENKIPPGFKDSEKDENGDYYIFYSLIKKSKEDNKDIIFITDDVKEDWFNEYNGEKHGGRYELLNEFYRETGNLLLIYTSDGFVKSYNKNIENSKSDEKIINELINIRNKEYTKAYNNFNYGKMLKYYKNNLSHSLSNLDKEEMYSYLFLMIGKLDLNEYQRRKVYRKLMHIKRISNHDLQISELLDFMELIEEHMLDYSREKYEINLLENIKTNYMNLVYELKNCKSKEEEKNIYNQIMKNIKEHLNIIEKSHSKYSYVMCSKLEKLLFELNNYQNDKIEIVEQIEQLIDEEKNFNYV